MTQETEIHKVKRLVRALLDRTIERGCTEYESMAAAEKAGKLIDVYQLDLTDLEFSPDRCRVCFIPVENVTRKSFDVVMMALARFCDCRHWLRGARGRGGEYVVFGFDADIAVFNDLYRLIRRTTNAELKRFKQTDTYKNAISRKSTSGSFCRGLCEQIAKRLRILKDLRGEAPRGQDLVLLKDQVIDDELNRLGVSRTEQARVIYWVRDQIAYQTGLHVGDGLEIVAPSRPGSASKSP